MIGIKELKREIKRQQRRIKKGKQDDYNFLGFVENDDLTPEVANLFTVITPSGYTYYDWVNGTEKMKDFVGSVAEAK